MAKRRAINLMYFEELPSVDVTQILIVIIIEIDQCFELLQNNWFLFYNLYFNYAFHVKSQ